MLTLTLTLTLGSPGAPDTYIPEGAGAGPRPTLYQGKVTLALTLTLTLPSPNPDYGVPTLPLHPFCWANQLNTQNMRVTPK